MIEQRELWRIISLLIFVMNRERTLLLQTRIHRINTCMHGGRNWESTTTEIFGPNGLCLILMNVCRMGYNTEILGGTRVWRPMRWWCGHYNLPELLTQPLVQPKPRRRIWDPPQESSFVSIFLPNAVPKPKQSAAHWWNIHRKDLASCIIWDIFQERYIGGI